MRGEADAKQEFASASRRIAMEFDKLRQQARSDQGRARSEAAASFDAAQLKAAKEHSDAIKPVLDLSALADSHRDRLAAIAADYVKLKLDPEPRPPSEEDLARFDDPIDELFNRLSRMEAPLKLLEGLLIPKLMKGTREVWVYILVVGSLLGIAVMAGGGAAGIGGGLAAGAASAGLLRVWLMKVSKNQLERLYMPLMHALADADNLVNDCRARVDARLHEARKVISARREEDLKKADANHARAITAAEARRDERLRKINEVYATRITDVQTQQQRDLRDAIDAHDRLMADLKAQAEAKTIKLDEKYRTLKEQVRARHAASWQAMAQSWHEGIRHAALEVDWVERQSADYCPRWDDPAWPSRALPRDLPPALRLGEITIDLGDLPGGISADPRLMEGVQTRYKLPALRPFPSRANLLIEYPPEGAPRP